MDAPTAYVSNLLAEGSTLLTVLSVVFYIVIGLTVFVILVGMFFCWLNKRADADFDDGTAAQPFNVRSPGSKGGTSDKRAIKKTPSKPLPARAKSTSSRPPQASTTTQL